MTLFPFIEATEMDENGFSLEPPPDDRKAERKQKRREYCARYRASNPERVKESKRKSYQANKETCKSKLKAYRKKDPEKAREWQRAERKAKPLQVYLRQKACTIKKKYNLTLQDLALMLERQKGRCLCCKTVIGLIKECFPSIDHCHATGKVRGLLCNRCNLTIGHAADSPKILRACARYLERRADPEPIP